MQAMVIRLVLSFPVRKWPLARRPRLVLAVLYGVSVAGPLGIALAGTFMLQFGVLLGWLR